MSSRRQKITPILGYADAPAAIRFLCDAFGFDERYRMAMPDGTVGYAELGLGDGVVALASEWPEARLYSPQKLDGLHAQVIVEVDDVDAHHRRAREAGATIAAEPADQPHGARMYRALDPEGHRWIFSMPLSADGR
jgi:uncharacterized glyoxalase superfamily protein PhnB